MTTFFEQSFSEESTAEGEGRMLTAALQADVGFIAVQSSQQAVCVTDAMVDEPGPRIEFVNDAYLDLFCCSADDVIGQNPRFAQGPLTSRTVRDRIRRALEAGSPVRSQAINYRCTGEAFRLRWTIDPIRDGDRVVRFAAVLQDVTADDRLRRRLAALDTLTSVLRCDWDSRGSAPDRATVQRALADAMSPIVTEIGVASVTIDGSGGGPVDVVGTEIERSRHEALEPVPIGDHGQVSMRIHPDALSLIDIAAVRELCDHTAWIIALGGGLRG